MDAFTRGHLETWAATQFLDDERDQAVEAIAAFVTDHPAILEAPRLASWPEVWTLVERNRA